VPRAPGPAEHHAVRPRVTGGASTANRCRLHRAHASLTCAGQSSGETGRPAPCQQARDPMTSCLPPIHASAFRGPSTDLRAARAASRENTNLGFHRPVPADSASYRAPWPRVNSRLQATAAPAERHRVIRRTRQGVRKLRTSRASSPQHQGSPVQPGPENPAAVQRLPAGRPRLVKHRRINNPGPEPPKGPFWQAAIRTCRVTVHGRFPPWSPGVSQHPAMREKRPFPAPTKFLI